MDNIYLIGFMGAGKSTVGRLLSKKLKSTFVDTDIVIEQKASQKISKIFEEMGEPYFRKLEAAVIQEVAEQKMTIVALGGGAVMNDKNWKILESTGTIYYLSWPEDIIFERILHSEHRPLVTATEIPERKAALQKKLYSRQPRYNQAHHIIYCFEGMRPEETVQSIIQILEKK